MKIIFHHPKPSFSILEEKFKKTNFSINDRYQNEKTEN